MHPFHTPQGLMQIALGIILALLLAPFIVSFVPAANKG
jgi:hypothetical protein